MNKKRREAPVISTGLTAAALQDHLSRQLSLSPPHKTHTPTHHCRKKKNNAHRERERDRERECVLDVAPPPLSLAERLGLVPRPHPQLTQSDWQQVKSSSREREDSTHPCPICQEQFGMRQQVLLSCSHVFHRQCLRSVERFSGHKTCPICRHRNYQTRLIYDGHTHHRIHSAIRIQSWWRGVRVRLWYHELRERVPPTDPTLRHKFYHKKLASLTTKMVESCAKSSSAADCVLAAADSALATARAAMRNMEYHSGLAATDWPSLKVKAIETLSITECPICISPLLAPQATPTGHAPRPMSLLSCGHTLHKACVSSLEQYCYSEAELPICPLCRAPYLRQPLHFYS